MPSEPLFESILEEFVEKLELMSRAEGYWHEYGEIELDSYKTVEDGKGKDFFPVGVAWEGEIPQDDTFGGEQPQRFRHFERVVITIPVSAHAGSLYKAASRVRMDVHKALMEGNKRCFVDNKGRATIYESSFEFQPMPETKAATMGQVAINYAIRHDHNVGDMATA